MKSFAWTSGNISNSFDISMPQLISVGKESSLQRNTPRVMHSHDDRLEVLMLVQGKGVHIVDGVEYQTSKGDIIIHDQYSVHDESSNTEIGMEVMSCALKNLKLKGLKENSLLLSNQRCIVSSEQYFDEISSILSAMHAFTLKNTPTSNEASSYLLRSFILIVRELIKEQVSEYSEPDYELGDHIKMYLDEHYLDDLTLQDIADNLNISPYYLSHVFKKITGYSPIQYVIHRRIGEAQTLLLNTDMNITDIAIKVGFNSINHFHNTFVKIVGLTAGQYRSKINNK